MNVWNLNVIAKAFYMSGKKPILITQGKYPSRQIDTGLEKRHTKDQ